MKARWGFCMILFICWFGVVTANAHDCCHHNYHDGDYYDCSHDSYQGTQAGPHCRHWAPSAQAAHMQTAEGKITEVIYLPGATPDSGMVEVRMQFDGQNRLIRLASAGFLKQGGLLLREGDAVTIKGFPVAGMEGDVLIATEIHKGDKTLSLRDPRGQPAW